jgi:cell wall-associated NlpC family hydrolase
MTAYAQEIAALALTQAGDSYVFGAKEPPSDPNPRAQGHPFDCSGLVAWVTGRLGVALNGGSWQQLATCRKAGLVIPIAQAISTRGALLFRGPNGDEHVVISLGNGFTIEARGRAYGVGSWPTANRGWTFAARIPGVIYATAPAGPATPAGKLLVDGDFGPMTVRAMQGALRVAPIDGVFGPATKKALQAMLHVVPDGDIGPITIRALQTHLDVTANGTWGASTTRAIQTELNAGTF